MKNTEYIQSVIEYIENAELDCLSLDKICKECGYSKYHLCRMFSPIVGLSIHEYIKRRKLTEAAKLLVNTEEKIIDIAISCGYSNQQSFSVAFKDLYKVTPLEYRNNKVFSPFQLKIDINMQNGIRGDLIMDIRVEKDKSIKLVGFTGNVKDGFHIIGMCFGQLASRKEEIKYRSDKEFLVGLNDYSTWNINESEMQAFDFYAVCEVEKFESTPDGMVEKELEKSDYLVFTYKAKKEDSLEPVVDYVYKEWLPNSDYVLNENAKYDFARYGETVDENGNSVIEYWVPIIS